MNQIPLFFAPADHLDASHYLGSKGARGRWTYEDEHGVRVYLLRPDTGRQEILRLKDESLERKYPWASYKEPRWKRGVPQIAELAGRYKQWVGRP